MLNEHPVLQIFFFSDLLANLDH